MIGARRLARIQAGSDYFQPKSQAGALCYRLVHGQLEILLVSTRKSKRWIIPKGWLIDGMTPSQSAQIEAWEEAGVTGLCATDAMGRFTHLKNRRKKDPILCHVDVFPLAVTSVSSDFPERDQRTRKWVSPQKAASLVNSLELSQLLRGLDPILH